MVLLGYFADLLDQIPPRPKDEMFDSPPPGARVKRKTLPEDFRLALSTICFLDEEHRRLKRSLVSETTGKPRRQLTDTENERESLISVLYEMFWHALKTEYRIFGGKMGITADWHVWHLKPDNSVHYKYQLRPVPVPMPKPIRPH